MSRIASQPPVRLDVAVGRAMVQPVDPATRAELESLQAAMLGREVAPEGIDPPSLVGEVFTFIMPRVSNPGVLRLERRRLLLERLEARASARDQDGGAAGGDAPGDDAPGDNLLAGGLMALRNELQNLVLLRRSRDSLIEG